MTHGWQERKRPQRLERREQFDDYDRLRDFLDLAADLSEELDYYPDMSFDREKVTMTIHAPEGDEEYPESALDFARRIDALVTEFGGSSNKEE